MKNSKKIMALLIALTLVVGTVIGGTVAWLVSKPEAVQNTFKVGELNITLDEAKTDRYGVVDQTAEKRVLENTYTMLPGHGYTKDPIVHLAANSEACYVFIDVDNQLKGAIAEGEYKLHLDTAETPVRKGIYEQIADNGWTALEVTHKGVKKTVYYQAFDTAAARAGQELPVFGYFHVSESMDEAGLKAYDGKTISITAYACQQDGFKNVTAAWNANFAK